MIYQTDLYVELVDAVNASNKRTHTGTVNEHTPEGCAGSGKNSGRVFPVGFPKFEFRVGFGSKKSGISGFFESGSGDPAQP
jgi:hypothetical protein